MAPVVAADGTWELPAGSGPCRTWPLDPDCGCLTRNPDGTWPDDAARAIEQATELLWRLTAGAFGLCQETLRPCRQPCTPYGHDGPVPALIDGRWWNIPCRCDQPANRCSCSEVSELRVPGPLHTDPDHPVTVYLDGTEHQADQGVFRVYGDVLMRSDGLRWPVCQDITAPLTEPDTFGVSYWRGTLVPPGGRRAVTLLACEVWKACADDITCKLPGRVQSVTREGVQYEMIDPTDYIKHGRTGVADIDMWLSSVNPRGLRQQPAVYSPDGPSWR